MAMADHHDPTSHAPALARPLDSFPRSA